MKHRIIILGAVAGVLAVAAREASGATGPRPTTFSSHHVDLARMAESLEHAPAESQANGIGVEVTLPLPDGRLERFRVLDSPIFGPELRRAHPELRTYRASGIDDPSLWARLDLTPIGLRAILFTPEGVALIDPLERGGSGDVMSYWIRDDAGAPFDCITETIPARGAAPGRPQVQVAGDQLRTFRFILMASGEYTQVLGGVSQALAEMTTAMNRNNAIFEHEVAVHLEVVQLLAFDDPATDPFPIGDSSDLLNRGGVVADSLFGTASWDMVQGLGITGNYRGVSFRPLFCYEGFKGQSGVTGPDPTSNQFEVKVMPHEIGHTLGATHSQDGGSNRSVLTPYEPGTGWTIMTSPGDALSFAEPFFHVASLDQMDTTLVSPAGLCGVTNPTGNTPPTVDAGADFTIPRGTPFVLTGSASDANAGDAVDYCWEEFDKAPLAGDLVNGPLFRSRFPSSLPSRSFPALATVLSGIADPLERLPTVDRLMLFRLTSRDHHPAAGGHASDEMLITVSGVPFEVTTPNGGNTIPSGSFGVAWQVGGGSVAASVDIRFSTNGGANWILLASAVANDGAHTVTYSTGTTRTTCRIMISAVGNVFYDVSNADFTIVGDPTAVGSPDEPSGLAITHLAPNPTRGALQIEYAIPRAGLVRLRILDVQGRVVATLVDGIREAGRAQATWSAGLLGAHAPGLYWVRIEMEGASAVQRAVVMP